MSDFLTNETLSANMPGDNDDEVLGLLDGFEQLIENVDDIEMYLGEEEEEPQTATIISNATERVPPNDCPPIPPQTNGAELASNQPTPATTVSTRIRVHENRKLLGPRAGKSLLRKRLERDDRREEPQRKKGKKIFPPQPLPTEKQIFPPEAAAAAQSIPPPSKQPQEEEEEPQLQSPERQDFDSKERNFLNKIKNFKRKLQLEQESQSEAVLGTERQIEAFRQTILEAEEQIGLLQVELRVEKGRLTDINRKVDKFNSFLSDL